MKATVETLGFHSFYFQIDLLSIKSGAAESARSRDFRATAIRDGGKPTEGDAHGAAKTRRKKVPSNISIARLIRRAWLVHNLRRAPISWGL